MGRGRALSNANLGSCPAASQAELSMKRGLVGVLGCGCPAVKRANGVLWKQVKMRMCGWTLMVLTVGEGVNVARGSRCRCW